ATGAAVAGGWVNTASGSYATIGGGDYNFAHGSYSTVPGGYGNRADGVASFAAGQNARAAHDGSFVWADSTSPSGLFESTAPNQFLVRASGGIGFSGPVSINNAATIYGGATLNDGATMNGQTTINGDLSLNLQQGAALQAFNGPMITRGY